MAEPLLVITRDVAPDAITVGKRLRPVSAAAVDAIVASFATIGAQIGAVALRDTEDGKLVLMCGAHRLAAARKMGFATIRADIWRCQDQIARFFEVHENLASPELSNLELAQFLAEAKDAYEALHPGTKQYVANNLARWGVLTDTVSVRENAGGALSFADAMAQQRGVDPRSIRRMTRLGRSLDPAAAEVIRRRPKAATVRELSFFAQYAPEQQRAIAEAWGGQTAKTPLEALRVTLGESARPSAPSPADRAYQALLSAWNKAPMKARRSFLETLADEYQQGQLLRDALAAEQKNKTFKRVQAARAATEAGAAPAWPAPGTRAQ